MVQKTVSDLIFDKFAGSIESDVLFKGISDNLIALIHERRHNKAELEKLLRKKQDEDPESGS